MSAASQKKGARVDRAVAHEVAVEICAALRDSCEHVIAAGSFRRGAQFVGDLEIVYVPRIEERPDPANMFRMLQHALADDAIARLESAGVLEKRLNAKGLQMFGEHNKYMRHQATLLPVDLFATTHDGWFNTLVLRTGPAELTARIALLAKQKGWKWNTYGVGFSRIDPSMDGAGEFTVASERDVFDFVGLPWLEANER